MSPPRERSARVPLATALLVLVVIAVSAALVRARAPGETWEDPPRYAGGAPLLELASVMTPARLAAPVRVHVVRDPASDPYFGGPATLDSLASRWASALRDIGAEAQVVGPSELAGSDADVLVIPSTPCLSAESFAAIEDADRRRRGLLVTRHTGIRDAGCTSVGAGLLIELTGASRLDTLEQRDETYVVFPAGGPLAVGMPPGARLELLAGNHVALRRPGRDAYWGTYSLDPAPASGRTLLDAAVVRGDASRERAVYWGFELTDVVDRPWNRDLVRLLLRNSIALAAGLPLVQVEAWPHGRRAAAVLAQDVEDEFANARHALDTLRAAGVPGTFFLVSELAREHEELVQALSEYGEIGTHSENHRLLGGLARDLQHRRLARTRAHLREMAGEPVVGLRPPEEQFDLATLAAWREVGGSYVFANNDGRAAGPELIRIDDGTMVLLGRVVNDDYAVVRRAGLTDPESQGSVYVREYEKVRALGGLYMFSYHSNMLARPGLVGALGPLARRLGSDSSAWLTTAREVADWWRTRAALQTDAEWDGDEIVLRVRHQGDMPLDGAVVRLVVGGEARGLSATGARLLPGEHGAIRVALPRLAPGASTSVRVRVERSRR